MRKENRGKYPLVKLIPVVTRSRAGVEYTHYKEVLPKFPEGSNRHQRRYDAVHPNKGPRIVHA